MLITPWYSKKIDLRLKDENGNAIAVNDDNDYIFKIEKWEFTKGVPSGKKKRIGGGYPYVDIPFTFRQLTATTKLCELYF